MSPKRLMYEMGVLVAIALAIAFWLVPSQTTSDPTVSLQPAALPTLCALAIAGIALTLFRPSQNKQDQPEKCLPPARWGILAVLVLIVAAGIAALAWIGTLAAPFVIVPAMMLMLGERRMGRILLTTLVIVVPLAWLGA